MYELNHVLRTVCLCAAAILHSASMGEAANPAPRPNVIIVMTDDQGLGDFSIMGNPVLKTPNLDAFARTSVRLTDFHVCPMCSPTRGQLLTGLTALRNGATSVTAGRTFLRPGLTTLPELFSKAGYRTGLFGKWHLGDHYPHRPMDRGFRESAYHLGWGQLQSTPEFDWPLIDGRYFHNGAPRRYQGHCTDVWFDLAMDWMGAAQKAGEPFLCYLPTNAPHAPHIDLPGDLEPYKGHPAARFFGMIAHIDRRFGDLERFLARTGLRDNTIVIFMTDNGGTAGVKTFNAGLRGSKTTYYEGGHRVPCWIRWPAGQLGEPRDVDVPTQNLDLLPTLCDWCQVTPPEWSPEDRPYRGDSLAGVLKAGGASLPARTLVVQYGQILKKYESCVIEGSWRLVKGAELYHVESDRAQATDLAEKHPDVVQRLRAYYDTWWAGLDRWRDEFVPISIGAKEQDLVELTSGDWEGIYADNSGFVRSAVGGPEGGHWHILVERDGEYTFTLRRWPETAHVPLGARYETSERSPANRPQEPKSRAFPEIAESRLEIAGVSRSFPANPEAESASVTVRLPAGRTRLRAWFCDKSGVGQCGAFFVTVSSKPVVSKP